jgi:hypothetical protein
VSNLTLRVSANSARDEKRVSAELTDFRRSFFAKKPSQKQREKMKLQKKL